MPSTKPTPTATPDPTTAPDRPEASVIGEMGRSLGVLATTPDLAIPGAVNTYVVPRGYRIEQVDYEDLGEAPRRVAGTYVDLRTTDSFTRYVARYRDIANLVYADDQSMSVVAVLNDHVNGAAPGWRDHRVTVRYELTPAWRRWTNAHGRYLEQDAFAELVEDGLTEIADPPGADLLELAQSITATSKAQFRSDRRLANGRVQLNYVESIDAAAGADGQLEIPSMITLVVEPFYGASARHLQARLRYRIAGGKLVLGVWLVRHAEVLRDAFDAELSRIEEAVDLRPMWGTP